MRTALARFGTRAPAVAAWAVGLTSAAFLALGVQHSLSTTASLTKPDFVRATTAAYAQEVCVRELVRTRVPEGAHVYIDASGYTFQLLAQYLAAWAEPADARNQASLQVSIVDVPNGPCGGLDVKVTRP